MLLKRYQPNILQRIKRDKAGENPEPGGSGGAGEGDKTTETDPGTGKTTETDPGNGAGAGSGEGGDGSGRKPSDEEARLLKENMRRKEENRELKNKLDAAAALEAQLSELGGLDALKQLVQTKKDAETAALEAKGEYSRVKEAMVTEHKRQLDAKSAELTAALAKATELESKLVEMTIGQQFSTSKYIGEDLVLTPMKARQLYGPHFAFEDGKVVGYDKPAGAADRTPLVDAEGNALSFDAAMAKIIEADPEKNHLLRVKGKSGSGSASNARIVPPVVDTSKLSGVDRIAAGLAAAKR